MNYFKTSKFFLYLALFSVLIVTSSTLFPFIVGKYVWFRAMVGFSFVFFLFGLLFQDSKSPEIAGKYELVSKRFRAILREPLVIAITIFIAIFLLAGFFGYDPSASFWSNFERGEGGFQLLNFYIFFLLLKTLFTKTKDWRNFFITTVSVSVLVILYGIGASIKMNGFIGPAGFCSRFAGSLGNPAYLAPYLVFTMFYAVWMWLFGNKDNKFRKYFYILLIAIFVFFFLLTQTRGSFLGLGVGLIVMFLYLAFKLPKGKKKTISGIVGVTLIVLGTLGVLFRHQNIPVVPFCSSSSRLLEISPTDKTAQTRFWTWGSAIKGWKERPILGWGPENFSVVFDRYFDARHFTPGEKSETWFDRAHSIYLDYLTEAGILGLLSYLSIFGVLFWKFIKKSKRVIKENKTEIFELSLFLGVFVAYLVQGVALFDVLPIYLVLFTTLAFSSFFFSSKKNEN